MNKLRFEIVGSGWRARYYIRIAMAMMLRQMRDFIESGKEPYSLKDALYDAYMAIRLREAVSK